MVVVGALRALFRERRSTFLAGIIIRFPCEGICARALVGG